MNIHKEAAMGIKWQFCASLIEKVISFLTTIILARILGPSNYGLFALGLLIVNFFGIFKSLGIESALIQRKHNLDKALNTAFCIIPIFSLILYLLLNFTAPIIAKFLNNSDLVQVIRMLGIIFIFWSLSRVPLTILEKDMHFAKISFIEVIGALVFSILAVILAISGFGVWSLVYGLIAKTVISTIFVWIFAKWKPRFIFDIKIALELFNFSKFVFLGYFFWALKANLDNFLVGKILGVEMLGLYAVAFGIANVVIDYFAGKVFRVIYPAYSKLQGNLEELKTTFLKVLKLAALFALPFAFGVYALGYEFLNFAYGEKWLGALRILKILTLGGVFTTLSTTAEPIFLALGNTKITFFVASFQVASFFIFIKPFASKFGLDGVGYVVTSAAFVAMVFNFYLARKLLSLNIKEIYFSLKSSILCSLLMMLCIICFKSFIPIFIRDFSIKFLFVLSFFIGLIVYLYSIKKEEKSFLKEIKSLVF